MRSEQHLGFLKNSNDTDFKSQYLQSLWESELELDLVTFRKSLIPWPVN